MDYDDHGGHCCGAKHLHSFDEIASKGTKQKLKDLISEIVENTEDGDAPLIEAILTNNQLKVWGDYLKDHLGFQEVISWENPNTNNWLTMLCVHKGTLKTDNL